MTIYVKPFHISMEGLEKVVLCRDDDPAFRAQFVGRRIAWGDEKQFAIVKGGAPEDQDNAIDAITGATMTSKGLDAAINTWLAAYEPYFTAGQTKEEE